MEHIKHNYVVLKYEHQMSGFETIPQYCVQCETKLQLWRFMLKHGTLDDLIQQSVNVLNNEQEDVLDTFSKECFKEEAPGFVKIVQKYGLNSKTYFDDNILIDFCGLLIEDGCPGYHEDKIWYEEVECYKIN